MNLAIRGDRVIVKTDPPEEFERNGLILTNKYSDEVVGTVVAVGDAKDVRVDDVVIFTEAAGQALEYEGQRYLVMHEDEILGVWE